MKFDRFTKVVLVLIALLLAQNCAQNLGNPPIIGRPADAAEPPKFLQVGEIYLVVYSLGGQQVIKILEIESTGWIKFAAMNYDYESDQYVQESYEKWVSPYAILTISEYSE
ncbi:MAG: hypothetical protein SFY66_06235 [Oculatellaceae cyanobacterium bins.114]|nr:hypothetical protein [Oculatellaceae cyanobacterium bins.114]